MSDNNFLFFLFLFEEFSISRFSCPSIFGVLLYSVLDTVRKTEIKKGWDKLILIYELSVQTDKDLYYTPNKEWTVLKNLNDKT